MSFNHSRSDKSDTQYRKTSRSASFNQQRNSSGGFGRGGSGGGVAPAPPSHSVNYSSNHSFRKVNNNVQGGQSRAWNRSESSNAPATGKVQNGAHVPSQVPVVPSSAARSTDSKTTQRSTQIVQNAPPSQPATVSSDTTMPITPVKAPGDTSKAFPFQFGSISPGFMNGMQIPARTSSAPPNLDEQKREQARHDSLTVPPLPVPSSVLKQQLPRKDAGAVDQSKTGEPKMRKDSQVSPAPLTSQMQKPSVHPISGISMPMNFLQPQASVQFGGPNPQIQSQGMPPNSLQMPMPMPLPIGSNSQVPQQVFVPGIQTHLMQPQGIMHQGQSLNFSSQMGSQLSAQMGNMGMSMTPPYSQQQGGKYGPRKTTVKITDPKTHEELRFDKRTDTYADGGSGPRSHPNLPPQSQPTPFTPSHPINYYPSSYNASPLYFPATSSLPSSNIQITPNSQAPRFNYPVGQAPQILPFVNQASLNPLPVSQIGTPMHGVVDPPISAPSAATHMPIKPAAGFRERVTDSALSDSSGADESFKLSRAMEEASASHTQTVSESFCEGTPQQLKPGHESLVPKSSEVGIEQCALASIPLSASAALLLESPPVELNTESVKKEPLRRSNSIRDHSKKASKKGVIPPQHQVGGQSNSLASLPSQDSEHSDRGVLETVETKPTLSPSIVSEVSGSIGQTLSTSAMDRPDASESKVDTVGEAYIPSELSGVGTIVDATGTVQDAKLDSSCLKDEKIKHETLEQPGEIRSHEGLNDMNSCEINLEPSYPKSAALDKRTEREFDLMTSTMSNEVPISETSRNAEIGIVFQGDKSDIIPGAASRSDNTDALTESVILDKQSAPVTAPCISEANLKNEGEGVENIDGGWGSRPTSSSKDKSITELNRLKSTTAKGKKKRKEILQKADAAGTTSDLYNAYKGPEEKKETVISSESSESVSTGNSSKQALFDALEEDTVANEHNELGIAEPDDWEDAAEISTPKLEASDNGEQVRGRLASHDKDVQGIVENKYGRDFLLKFAEKCTDLPEGFEMSDMAEALMSTNVNIPSPGRNMDRQTGRSRQDRRGSNMVDDDRWNKTPGSFGSGREVRLDLGYAGNAGFRPGQTGNYGVLRNPRAQTPNQYAGGILSGPMQSMGSKGGMQRNIPDSDRWQRATNFQQKGLIPSPQTPLQMMHKAERKYEVGKVNDEEQAKQRQLKAILNKLTPQNFEKLFEQVKEVNIDNGRTLTGVISQIFDKALMEPTFCEMYANFCFYLAAELPDLSEGNEKITFKRLLLNKCQEEFERGEREEEEANKVEEDGETKQSEAEREEKRVKARRRMLGNIRLIGELYKKRMLTERIMHECIKKLLGQYQNPDEEDVEALCKLMSTIGEMIDHPKAKEHMDAYFEMMTKLSNNMKLSSRVRFMLKDSIDLRKNKWQQRRKVEGPKKIEDVHRDAAQERHAQSSRLARGPSMNSSARRVPSVDFGSRGSTMLSPNLHMGGFRGLPTQPRGFSIQDVRLDDRQSFDPRALSVSLPQRHAGDDSITLGPQGGLARGMSSRGLPAMSSVPLVADMSSSTGDSRRGAAGLNGYSSASDQTSYSSREDLIQRFVPDRFTGPGAYDQSSAQERNMNYSNRDRRNPDRSFERSLPTSAPTRGQGPVSTPNVPPEKVWPEERLQDMSMAAIKEFYSARDEKEVALCVKELNAPSFHPSMISLWVTDSFDRKDVERDLLAKLLVNLTKSMDGVLNQSQLIKGFESVLSILEDAVNDAPKAPEYIGNLFSRIILENVISLGDIGHLLHEGGEERGSLLEVGLAADVIGSVLERIISEKGETFLNDIRLSSNLRLESFRPLDPNRSRKLDKFI